MKGKLTIFEDGKMTENVANFLEHYISGLNTKHFCDAGDTIAAYLFKRLLNGDEIDLYLKGGKAWHEDMSKAYEDIKWSRPTSLCIDAKFNGYQGMLAISINASGLVTISAHT